MPKTFGSQKVSKYIKLIKCPIFYHLLYAPRLISVFFLHGLDITFSFVQNRNSMSRN